MMRNRKTATVGTSAAILALALAATSALVPGGRADNDDNEAKIQQGFAIAPVQLNLNGKNRAWIGLGSYLVNTSTCNECHTNPPFAAGHNPFLGQPKQLNAAGYLGGGTLIGTVVSRNLTPDKTGLPEGGASFEEFRSIIRTGIDPDHAHPQFGPYLQVMPWPAFQNMTDNDLRAIYEYLSAIPCVEGDPGLPNPRPVGTRCQ